MTERHPRDASVLVPCWTQSESPKEAQSPVLAERPAGQEAVEAFVRTPFAVRCHIVAIWRLLPRDIWTALASARAIDESRRRERHALLCVVLMALLLAGLSSVGYRAYGREATVSFPLLGGSFASSSVVGASSGWYMAPGERLPSALWVAVPPLVGWALVRSIWIPMATAGQPTRQATMAFARQLSGVYLYVYLMIVLGAALIALLVWASPVRTEAFRWCLWCFLFGESFFVPTAMWTRLILNDTSGQVFGRSRHVLLTLYVALFVAVPMRGMWVTMIG